MSRARFFGVCLVPSLAVLLMLGLGAGYAHADEPASGDELDLTDKQVQAISIGTLGTQSFAVEQMAVGNIDFDEDMEAQIYPPYQGRILQVFVRTGDQVRKNQPLYSVDSPDLVQAESTLISADATLRVNDRALARAADLYRTRGMSQKDYDQAIADQQTAEGSLGAARDALRIFGKSDADIGRIIASRQVDPALVMRSPMDGVVVLRNAAPGMFAQPGTPPAPLTVADTSVMWMLANAPENLSADVKVGEKVTVHIDALPGRSFTGKLVAIGTSIDPTTRRFVLRSEIHDPTHILRSGMFANFTITTSEPVDSLAVPMNGIVREGDGTMSAWTTVNRRHFVRRTVKIGLESNGYRQILDGLQPGELVVTDGAVFLSNMLTADPSD